MSRLSPDAYFLYERKKNYIPRIAAVHDLCGYGKCSLGVAIPVLSAAGCDVCPLPTSLFSAHTLFRDFYYLDTTSMMEPYLDAWEREGIELDAIYSGFLGAAEQISAIKRLYTTFSSALRFVDPVMGDGGKMYPTYTQELCKATAELVPFADVLTPNLTEAHLLTGLPYEGDCISHKQAERTLDALLEMGAKTVILKGISQKDGTIKNFIGGREITSTVVHHTELPFKLHGTGDLFASSTLAALMSGHSLLDATQFASKFVYSAMLISKEQPNYQMRGVSFEPCLGQVASLLDRGAHEGA